MPKIRFSIRYKILVILLSLPLISLGLYLLMATDLFKSDKIAYVYDSSAAVSRGLAAQVRMESQNAYANLRGIVENFDFPTNDFSPTGKLLFSRAERVHAVLLYRRDPAGQYVKLGQLIKEEPVAQAFVADERLLVQLRDQAVARTVALNERDSAPGLVTAAYRLGELKDPNHMVVVGLYQADDLLGAFQGTGLYNSFVIPKEGTVAIGALQVVDDDLSTLRQALRGAGDAKEGTAESKLADGQTYLISFANVGVGDLIVISKVDKKKALKAVEVLVVKSLLFFAALLATTLIVSVIVSNRLTATLRELFEATRKIAQGNFDVRIVPRSNDEVGGLAHSFNWMAAEVSRLLVDTAEQARMASELSTVRTVQETLFPAAQAQFGPLKIMGHFEPASECGGDWWSYSRIGNRIFLWIGDATGHGAPAALITSAATSAAAVIEMIPDVTPARAMTILNRAILQTSKGQIMMTFFIACIDLDTQTFTYASASHDPPYLMRRTGPQLVKKDLVPLNAVNGPRLGDRKDHVYEDIAIDFLPGDLLFLYTDGILDIEDPEGKKISERQFLKHLVESANFEGPIEAKLGNLRKGLDGHRRGATLIDDVTMVLCQFDKSS